MALKIELWAHSTHWHAVIKGEVDLRHKTKSMTDYIIIPYLDKTYPLHKVFIFHISWIL